MPNESKAGRKSVGIALRPKEFKRLEQFRTEHNFASRAEAAKWLIDWALERQELEEPERQKDKPKGRYRRVSFDGSHK